MCTRPILLSCLLVLMVAACGQTAVTDDDDDQNGAAGTVAGSYTLVEGAGPDGPLPLLESHRVTLVIEGDEVMGTAACNSYGGQVTVDPPTFALSELAVTEMACEPPETLVLQRAYLDALQLANTIESDEDGIRLSGPGVSLTFEAQPPVPTASLTDAVWVLDGLITGTGPEAAVSSVAGEEATLELRADGTMRGSTGCRSLEGTWTESGEEVLLTELGAHGECPPERAEQDSHVITVLGDGFVPTVDGQRLTLTDGALGLSYRVDSP